MSTDQSPLLPVMYQDDGGASCDQQGYEAVESGKNATLKIVKLQKPRKEKDRLRLVVIIRRFLRIYVIASIAKFVHLLVTSKLNLFRVAKKY